jgi:hypothetical protein
VNCHLHEDFTMKHIITMSLPGECISPDMADKWRLTVDRLKTLLFSVEMKSAVTTQRQFLAHFGMW